MPLMFDLPLEQLKTYAGTNPRPADFDTYWDESLAEMHALDPQVELIPASFQAPFAECFHLYFSGVGGARVHAHLIQPLDAPQPHPAVLFFHGYASRIKNFYAYLPYAAAGFTVAALDVRGQGGLSDDSISASGNNLRGQIIRGLDDPDPKKMAFRRNFLDAAQLARIVMDMPQVDAQRVGATGGSQGGGLTLACAALEPRIRRIVPIFPFLSDYQRVWKIDLDENAYEELRWYFRTHDPRHEREQEIFTRLGYIDVQHLCPRIQSEVLMLTGLMDKICPPSTQFAAYNKIEAPKSVVFYPDFGHEKDIEEYHADRIFEFMLGM